MKRLIDEEQAFRVLSDYYKHRTTVQDWALHDALSRVPTAETDLSEYSDRLWKIAYERGKAEAVKRGKWLWLDCVRCSQCNYKLPTTGLPSYCPNCGADMRGEEDAEH